MGLDLLEVCDRADDFWWHPPEEHAAGWEDWVAVATSAMSEDVMCAGWLSDGGAELMAYRAAMTLEPPARFTGTAEHLRMLQRAAKALAPRWPYLVEGTFEDPGTIELHTRVVVCGGRDYAGAEVVARELDRLVKELGRIVVVHGACRARRTPIRAPSWSPDDPTVWYYDDRTSQGADGLARAWAVSRKMPHEAHPARWKEEGRSAGPRRNREMAAWGAGLCVAFPGGAGTSDCTGACEAAGIPVRWV